VLMDSLHGVLLTGITLLDVEDIDGEQLLSTGVKPL
jgi:hypothetical protein